MLDTKTGKFTEWQLPTPWTMPYPATGDKNGEAWTGGMNTDRVVRINSKTGEIIDYLKMPKRHDQTYRRRVFVRQFHHACNFLGGQRPRRFDHQGGTAGLKNFWQPASLVPEQSEGLYRVASAKSLCGDG